LLRPTSRIRNRRTPPPLGLRNNPPATETSQNHGPCVPSLRRACITQSRKGCCTLFAVSFPAPPPGPLSLLQILIVRIGRSCFCGPTTLTKMHQRTCFVDKACFCGQTNQHRPTDQYASNVHPRNSPCENPNFLLTCPPRQIDPRKSPRFPLSPSDKIFPFSGLLPRSFARASFPWEDGRGEGTCLPPGYPEPLNEARVTLPLPSDSARTPTANERSQ